jgi:hypothetical protein
MAVSVLAKVRQEAVKKEKFGYLRKIRRFTKNS